MKKILVHKNKVILVVVAAIVLFIGFRFIGGKDNTEVAVNETVRLVETASVRELSQTKDPLSLVGVVKSESEVTLRTEAQGTISNVYARIGDFVPEGTIIAEIENSRERAAVLQAQASVDSAEANLMRAQSLSGVAGSEGEVQISIINTLESAFTKVDDAIRAKADQLFYDPRNDNARLNVGEIQQGEINNLRIELEDDLRVWERWLEDISEESDLLVRVDEAESYVDKAKKLLVEISSVVNRLSKVKYTESQISAWQAMLLSARTNLDTTASSLVSARSTLSDSDTSLTVAGAGLAQAKATLLSANANLEKTLLRTPIAGEITLLSVKRGDFVGAFDPVVVVSNDGALEIVTSITEDDKKEIKVGSEVQVEGGLTGLVSSVASALDEKTKKLEVRIAVPESEEELFSGEAVRVNIERGSDENIIIENLLVPIAAIKIGANETVVFSVNELKELVAHPVTTGAIIGQKIFILDGIDADLEIVLDARGFKEGDKVVVAN